MKGFGPAGLHYEAGEQSPEGEVTSEPPFLSSIGFPCRAVWPCHYPKSSLADSDVVQRCMLRSIVGWRRFDNEEWANTVKRMNAAGGSGLGLGLARGRRKGCRGSRTPCPRTGGPTSATSSRCRATHFQNGRQASANADRKKKRRTRARLVGPAGKAAVAAMARALPALLRSPGSTQGRARRQESTRILIPNVWGPRRRREPGRTGRAIFFLVGTFLQFFCAVKQGNGMRRQ